MSFLIHIDNKKKDILICVFNFTEKNTEVTKEIVIITCQKKKKRKSKSIKRKGIKS